MLRYEDLRLTSTANAPYGAIQWPGESDKEGRTWRAPVTPKVRVALDRIIAERPGIGAAHLFPVADGLDESNFERLGGEVAHQS